MSVRRSTVGHHTGVQAEGSGRFAAFGVDAFRRIWFATLCYFLSIFAQGIARGWLALELTGTNTGLGTVTLAYGLAAMVMTPLGGVVTDRFPRRHLVLGATALLGAASLLLGLAVETGAIAFWMLLVGSAVEATAYGILVPARMALTAEVVGPELLHNAVALSQVGMNVNRILGPALAGALIAVAWLGPGAVYLFCGALSLVAVVILRGLPAEVGTLVPVGQPGPSSALGAILDGLRYARRTPQLGRLLATAMVVTCFGFSYVTFLPMVAEEFGTGSAGYSVLSAVGAVGGVIASVAIAGRLGAIHGWRVQAVSAFGFGACVVALGLAPSFWVAVGAATVLGACVAGFQSMNGTLAMTVAEPEFHGRMQSLVQLGFALYGLVGLPLGLLADAVGLHAVLVGMGAVCMVAVVVGQVVPDRAVGSAQAPIA
ncbi:MAG: MFS transporter [Actinobacteria bacterium]|nr:MFS transporter [Actinomycetota bacterium]